MSNLLVPAAVDVIKRVHEQVNLDLPVILNEYVDTLIRHGIPRLLADREVLVKALRLALGKEATANHPYAHHDQWLTHRKEAERILARVEGREP